MSTLALRPLRRRYFRSPHVLFRWRAGLPFPAGASFSRGSPAWYIGPDGVLREAESNVPRIEWLDRDGDGVRETPALRLEGAWTNLVPWSSALSQWATSGATTATDDALVLGALSLALVEDADVAVMAFRHINVAFTGDGEKAVSCYVAAGTSTTVDLKLRDYTASVDRLRATITWAAGVPSVSMLAGTHLYTEPVGGGVYRLWFRSASVIAANSHRVELFPAAGNASRTGSIYVGGVQVENASVPSSLFITTGAPASRAVELFSAPFPPVPQAMTVYARFVEAGTIAITSGFPRIVQIGAAAGARLVMYCNNAGRYGFDYFTAAGVQRSVVLATGPSIGQTVELLGTLYSDGSVQLEQSIDGGSVTATARSAASALSSAWSAAMLTIGSAPGGGSAGQTDLLDLLILRGAGWTIDQVRAYLPGW